MKRYLIFKLLAANLLVIGFVMVVVWLSIDTLAAGYFVTLMEKYNISPKPAHAMFLHAIHRYLIWAFSTAVILAVSLSFLMMRRVLAPLSKMSLITQEIASGNFSVRIPVRSQDEVGRLARSFNRMAESLEKLENLRYKLMIDVAHELRTPLTNIRGYLEALNDEVLPPSTKTFAMLLQETLRLVQLVEDVLQLARADAVQGNLKIEPDVDIKAMVRAALQNFARRIAQQSIRIVIQAPPGAITIPADRQHLARILRNLTANAARYAQPGSRVTIRIQVFQSQLRITYGNRSAGLAEDDLPYLFERFYRGEKSRSRRHGGAGIGLAIVKELVRAHGGQVGAELQGDQFYIWFTLPTRARGPQAP